MADERKRFIFPDDAHAPMSVEMRQAHALEFIAYYLDRIEGHLQRLADDHQPNLGERIAKELAGIQTAINRHLQIRSD